MHQSQMQHTQKDELLWTPTELARFAQVRPQMVYAYMRTGKLLFVYDLRPVKQTRTRGRRMIEREEALGWANQQTSRRLERTRKRASLIEAQLTGKGATY